MGSTLSHTSLEWAIAAGIAGAAAYSYLTYSNSGTPSTNTSDHPTTGRKGTKSKKKKQLPKSTGVSKPTTTATTATATSAHGNPVPEPTVVPFPHVIPGEFDATKTNKKKKTKKEKQKEKEKPKEKVTGSGLDDASERQSSSLASQSGGDVPRTYIDMPSEMFSPKAEQELRTLPIRSSSPSFDTDSSWMRIDTRQTARGANTGSDNQILAITTDMTSSDVGPSTGDSPIAERTDEDESLGPDAGTPGDKRRTLAERLLPRHRKTAVDDMLERPDYPGLARVMRVQPRADEAPAPGFSWKDYEDVDDSSYTLNDADGEGDGEWGIVKGKGRSKVSRPSSTPSQLVQQVPQALTKKQRQNAKKHQMLKDAKAEAETERLAKLAERRRALEREKIIDQSRRGGGKQTSGGMQATVDSRGKLVWD
ncbi:hypothetical protein BD769DRAFT_1696519 [Suillus cothurnatus]|nr:hypothetical protein BD769DRAFT_1696519 [Suillus cothurnatus]